MSGRVSAILQTTNDMLDGTGCFRISNSARQNSNIYNGDGSDNTVTIDFSAARSNAIFGAASMVQPAAIQLLMIIKS